MLHTIVQDPYAVVSFCCGAPLEDMLTYHSLFVAALAGLADVNGSAMVAARQAAAAQLEQFRAEMMAEAAKMRAAVERQVQ